MTTQQIISALLVAESSELKEVFAALAKGFSEKAESLYDANPEENGLIAQPYAEIADTCLSASLAFDEPEDSAPIEEEPQPVTVSAVVERSMQNPWGRR